MAMHNTCPSATQLEQLALGALPEPPAKSVEEHVLACEHCAKATLALAADDTLLSSLRRAAQQPSANPDNAPHNVPDDFPPFAARIRRLIETLRELPERTRQNEVLCDERPQHESPDNDWSACFSPAESADEIGRLGDFRVLKLLGQGGMGGVFLAEDVQLGRQVALKIILPDVAAKPGATERFLREAKAVAALSDERIVTIYQVGRSRGVPFLSQELLQGETLEARLQREGLLPIEDCLEIARQVAEGLAVAHQRGLVHRDVKPANIFLVAPAKDVTAVDEGPHTTNAISVKLLDFGLARSLQDSDNLTQSGTILGTPVYMAPEQASGEAPDGRADLFSLGCVLYRMLTGKLAFEGKDVIAVLAALATHNPPPPRQLNTLVPVELSELVLKLLAKSSAERPDSARTVARELALIKTSGEKRAVNIRDNLSNVPPPFHRFRGGMFGAAAVALLGVIVIIVRTKDGREIRQTIDVPGDVASVTTVIENQTDATPSQRKAAIKVGITLDHLDPKTIPAAERFAWQPPDLVAVIGTHQSRCWEHAVHLLIHPSGNSFISFGNNPTEVRWWSIPTGKLLSGNGAPGFPTEMDRLTAHFSADGKYLLTRNGKYGIDLSNQESPGLSFIGKFDGRKDGLSAITADGRWLLVASASPGTIQIWNIAENTPQLVKEISIANFGTAHRLCVSNDGRRLALLADGLALSANRAVRLWDVDWSKPDDPVVTPWESVIAADVANLSPDGEILVVHQLNRPEAEILDLKSQPPRVQQKIGSALQYEFSADSRQLVVGGLSQISFLDRGEAHWELRKTITPVTGMNARFQLSSDGKTLVVSEHDSGYLRVWDVNSAEPIERTSSPYYSSIAMSPDGRWLATGGLTQGTVWDLSDAAPHQLKGLEAVGSSQQQVVSFSSDSRLVSFHHIALGSHVWDIMDSPPRRIDNGPQAFVSFAPLGQLAWSWSDASRLSVYPWEVSRRGQFRLGSEPTSSITLPSGTSPALSLRSLHNSANRYVNLQDGGKLQVFEHPGDGKLLWELQFPGKEGFKFTLSPDGTVLAALPAAVEGTGNVWDLTESPPRPYQLAAMTALESLFSPNGRLLFVANNSGVDIYDWVAGRVVRSIRLPGRVIQLAIHSDRHHLVTVNGNGTIYILRLPELADVDRRTGKKPL